MGTYDQAKDILQRTDPEAVLRPQPAADWKGEYPLPAAVATYYAEFGPDNVSIPGYGNGYFLPSLADLWAHQTGYRTDGRTGERLPDWEEDWLVVGDEGADPFIFSRESGTILRAYHGEGKWEPQGLFRDLAETVTTLAILGEIVATAGMSLTDEDGLIQAHYLEAAEARLTPVTGSAERATAILRVWNGNAKASSTRPGGGSLRQTLRLATLARNSHRRGWGPSDGHRKKIIKAIFDRRWNKLCPA